MGMERSGPVLTLVALVALSACGGEGSAPAGGASGTLTKGGDDRSGPYEVVEGWWKPAPDHTAGWTWGSVSGVAADSPDRIIVAVWGDQNAEGQERPGSTNYLVVVNRNGDIIENWSQWDSIFNRPHQVYISPYDPERHVWIVERGGNGVHEQILEFSNDGSKLVMRLRDPQPVMSEEETRANQNPGPLDFGQPAVMAFLPDGHFLLGDGYQNGRIAKYTTDGEFVTQFGSVGMGPGQFDLVHGAAVDGSGRIYVSDRMNHRIQVFSENGEYIEEWPNIYDPVGIFIDENEMLWVLDATLNRMLKYSREGELLDYWGAYGEVSSLGRRGWPGGMSLPHQMDIDEEGNLYVAEFGGPWLDKFVPKRGADPARLVGRRLIGTN
ncbi:MAG: hypothetical protein HY701_02555 [Gemmatimonadetes bacterium]|nr:hypothetical protein [Gemmatimonadota bacterium]